MPEHIESHRVRKNGRGNIGMPGVENASRVVKQKGKMMMRRAGMGNERAARTAGASMEDLNRGYKHRP